VVLPQHVAEYKQRHRAKYDWESVLLYLLIAATDKDLRSSFGDGARADMPQGERTGKV